MFKLTGMKDGMKTAVVWDKGRMTPSEAGAHVRAEINRHFQRAGAEKESHTVFLQSCTVAISDPLYCYWKLSEWLDSVDEVEGETGLLETPNGVIQ